MLLAWTLFLLYVLVTIYLAYLGSRKTTSFRSYAVGNQDMNPYVAGIALAATMTSTATFVINPGIIYAYGFSGVLGYGVAAGLGLGLGIVILSKGFRKHGVMTAALTVPQWIGTRYGDRRLTVFYALVNLLLIAMVVLICYGMAVLLLATLRLPEIFPAAPFELALFMIIAFVFTYIFFGGTYAHAYTNVTQGLIMLVVAGLLIGSGWHLFDGHFLEKLAAIDPALASPINPNSLLFRNYFEVFGANFVVGFALAVQPHFIIKALYVKTERDVNLYLAVAVLIGIIFTMVLLCGLYARLTAQDFVTQFITANKTGIDGVMPAYIVKTFSPAVGIIISVAILAAGMSTLDGMLVAISAIFANDIFLVLSRRGEMSESDKHRLGLRAGRYSLIGLGLVAFVLAILQHYHKELSVAIFAQEGVYALFAATFAPLLFGMFRSQVPKMVVVAASLAALLVHFGFRYGKLTLLTSADYTNPGLTAAYGLLLSLVIVAGYFIISRKRSAASAATLRA